MSTEILSKITIDENHVMAKAEAEMHHAAILNNVDDIGMRMLKMGVERGWSALGYESFRDYVTDLDRDMGSVAKNYRLLDQARVNRNLTIAMGRPIRLPVQHALKLKDLEPEKQVEAFREVIKDFKKGDPKPNEKVFEKAAHRFAPKSKSGATRAKRDLSKGWDAEALSKDEELADHFDMIEEVYGKADVDAIKKGTVPMKRVDVIFLARLPKERMQAIQDLMFSTRWTPEQCIKFINTDLDGNSTLEDAANQCLSIKGKFWSAEIDGFLHTCKPARAIKR